MFITPAYAQIPGLDSEQMGSIIGTVFPFILIFAVMYFLMIRPQQKQLKKKREQLEAIRRGDIIITGGGIIGRVTRVFNDINEIEVEVSENVRIKVTRYSISDVRIKEPLVKSGKETPEK